MNKEYEIVKDAYESIKNKMPYIPEIALVLGSGLSTFLDGKAVDKEIAYEEIKNLPKPTVAGHSGKFIFLHIGDKKVVCLSGRVHYYEGNSTIEAVRPIRLLKLMGIEKLILTNAAGGVNKSLNKNDFMLITDHNALLMPNPLRGENIDEFGPRFPDMTEAYNKNLSDSIRKAAKNLNIDLKEGTYMQLPGPTYETKAEVSFASILGADAVGMSTAIETIAAHHAGMKVCGVSLITNMAAGIAPGPLNHEDVVKEGKASSEKFSKLIEESIKLM